MSLRPDPTDPADMTAEEQLGGSRAGERHGVARLALSPTPHRCLLVPHDDR